MKAADDKLASIPLSDANFDNSILAYVNATSQFSGESAILVFLMEISPDKNIRDASMKSVETFNKYEIESSMREDIYAIIKTIFDNKEEMAQLSEEQQRLVTKFEQYLCRNGVALPKEQREEMIKLKKELEDLKTKFSRNIAENDAEILFTRQELDGLPEDFFEGRESRNVDGVDKYVVTTKYPDLFPVMELCKISKTRHDLHVKNGTRCPENIALIEKAIKLRYQIAKVNMHVYTRSCLNSIV